MGSGMRTKQPFSRTFMSSSHNTFQPSKVSTHSSSSACRWSVNLEPRHTLPPSHPLQRHPFALTFWVIHPCWREKASAEPHEPAPMPPSAAWPSVSVSPAHSHPAGRAFVVFHHSDQDRQTDCVYPGGDWSSRLIKCPGFCHPFVHVWSHISHLSLLGSYNLQEAFSRNPADSVIWSGLWLFTIEFIYIYIYIGRSPKVKRRRVTVREIACKVILRK